MKGENVLFSSLSDEWRTPESVYKKLDAEFHFDFDPCPTGGRLGFFESWGGSNFINPPYSEVARWVEKACSESRKGKVCVLLVAARTDTRWFHDFCIPFAREIRFIRGRVKFVSHEGKHGHAPFPSMIVIFDGRGDKT